MTDEELVYCEGGKDEKLITVSAIRLPELSFYALFLSEQEAETLYYCETTARDILDKIVSRQKFDFVQEEFRIDVPDLWPICDKFVGEERTALMDFFAMFLSIIRYFLPDCRQQPYDKEGIKEAGMVFVGNGWYTKK